MLAVEPLLRIGLETDRCNRPELLALLNLVKPFPHPFVERRSDDRPITKSAGSDLVATVDPAENEPPSQHFRPAFAASAPHVEATNDQRPIRVQRQSAIRVPLDLGLASEVKLGIDRRPDC